MKKLILFPATLATALAAALVWNTCSTDRVANDAPAPAETTNGGVADAPLTPITFDSPSTKQLEAELQANAAKLSENEAKSTTRAVPVAWRAAKTSTLAPQDDWMRDGGMPLTLPNEKSGSSFEASGGSSGEGAPSHEDVPGQKIWATK